MKRFLFCLTILCLSGCADLLNFTISSDGYTVTRNLEYGDFPRQQLDIYVPEKKAPGAPVVIFFHGGKWQMGSKDDYLFVGQALASKGITAVIANYRIYPDVRYPVFMEDAAKAVAWTQGHIEAHGGNPRNIFVMGHSAGAHIALMLTTNASYLQQAGGKLPWLRGAIGLSGPYDFLPFTEDDVKDIFSRVPPSETQPINYVRAGMPPVFLATGDDDTTVKPKNSYNLAAKLKEQRNKVEVHTYKDVAHIGIVLALADGFRYKAPVLKDVAAFVQKYGVKE